MTRCWRPSRRWRRRGRRRSTCTGRWRACRRCLAPCRRRARRGRLAGSGTDRRRGRRAVPAHRRARAATAAPASVRAVTLDVMTHCNAGWLATVDYGTALAPVYAAFDAGIDVHVWVSETRPRNQGLLTAWELDSTACRTRSSPTTPPACCCARRGRRGDRRRRPHRRQRRRRQQDRHLSEGAGGARNRRAVLRRRAALDDRLRLRRRRGDSHRGARRRRTARRARLRCHAGRPALRSCRPTRPSPTRPSTSRRRALVSALVTERGSCAGQRRRLLSLYPEERHG
jgi:methylthioribose-1-phosphate isomerase